MTRRWVTAVALLLLVLLPAKAQKRWGVVPTIGVQVSQVIQQKSGTPLVTIKGGVMGHYLLFSGDLGRIRIESGLLASEIGFRGEGGSPINRYHSTALEVPVLLGLDINLTQQVNSFLRIGSYYRRTLSAVEEIDPNDYGIQVGIGAEYGHWVVALDGTFGTHSINRGKQGKAKHINGCLSLGYNF